MPMPFIPESLSVVSDLESQCKAKWCKFITYGWRPKGYSLLTGFFSLYNYWVYFTVASRPEYHRKYYASSPHLTSCLASSIRAQAYVSGFTYSLCPNYMLQAKLPPTTHLYVRVCNSMMRGAKCESPPGSIFSACGGKVRILCL